MVNHICIWHVSGVMNLNLRFTVRRNRENYIKIQQKTLKQGKHMGDLHKIEMSKFICKHTFYAASIRLLS